MTWKFNDTKPLAPLAITQQIVSTGISYNHDSLPFDSWRRKGRAWPRSAFSLAWSWVGVKRWLWKLRGGGVTTVKRTVDTLLPRWFQKKRQLSRRNSRGDSEIKGFKRSRDRGSETCASSRSLDNKSVIVNYFLFAESDFRRKPIGQVVCGGQAFNSPAFPRIPSGSKGSGIIKSGICEEFLLVNFGIFQGKQKFCAFCEMSKQSDRGRRKAKGRTINNLTKLLSFYNNYP